MKQNKVFFYTIIALLAVSTGFFSQQYLASETSAASNYRPDFSLPDIDGKMRHINEWDGQVILLNFWASWCPPCRKELPDFVRLYEDYQDQGFVVVGVAIDNKQDIIDFIDPIGVEYPVLISELDGIKIAQLYGNRLSALPYTVIIDRKGNIVSSHIQLLNYNDVEKMIKPLL
ncbi:MAG: TlpA family protein disulfide reductase [Gammaproteobacteria bacterium]|nr:TlpA family protein disulfide reductase [Gammaproteobacteria bacterium]